LESILCNRVTDPVFELLLLPGVPAGDILQVAGNPADLNDIMGTAFGTDGLFAERAVLNPGYHLVGAAAVIERTHHFEMSLAAIGAGLGIDNKVTGMALVMPFFFRYFFDSLVFFCQIRLFRAPIHTTTLQEFLINF
jgi:hypothetical protein